MLLDFVVDRMGKNKVGQYFHRGRSLFAYYCKAYEELYRESLVVSLYILFVPCQVCEERIERYVKHFKLRSDSVKIIINPSLCLLHIFQARLETGRITLL